LACGFVARRVTEHCGYAPLLAPRHKPKSQQQTVFYPTVWGVNDTAPKKAIVLLIEPSPKAYIERGHLEQPESIAQTAWAHPVIANGRLYIRNEDTLFCYDIKVK